MDFDPGCVRCARLAGFLADVRIANPGYHCRPVPSFGAPDAPLLVVGLAPGMHGANASGRPFTGDYAGVSKANFQIESGTTLIQRACNTATTAASSSSLSSGVTI